MHYLFSIELFLYGQSQFLYDIGLSDIGARTEGLGGNFIFSKKQNKKILPVRE